VVATRKKNWRHDGHKLDRQRNWLDVFQEPPYRIRSVAALGVERLVHVNGTTMTASLPFALLNPQRRRDSRLSRRIPSMKRRDLIKPALD
jgi:hypothetical protein